MRTRQGFTLIELLIAMVVFVIVLGGALSFLTAQQRAFQKGSDAMGVLQNLSFGSDNLDSQIRTAGGNAPDAQPPVVYAGPTAFAFNADYVSNDAGDISAVYVDPDAPAAETEAMRVTGPITIPTSSPAFVYPSTDYTSAGYNSPAETIILYFDVNNETPRGDDFLLLRQVNGNAPEVLVRNILRDSTNLPFFRYFKLRVAVAGQLPALTLVPAAEMPMAHVLATHGNVADLVPAGRIDSLRAVLVSFRVTNGETGTIERSERISMNIPLPNMGLKSLKICGSQPVLGQPLTAVFDTTGGLEKVNLTWNPAYDENSGESDVIRYVLWRRKLNPGPPEIYGDPLSSVAAGFPNYLFTDAQNLESNVTYEYRLAAQDCSPKLSTPVMTPVVTTP
ncbi:MAG: prepilin-type N-terminal cleavage/methylation domain-containing protein [Gemmatimonadales bacterium]|nr:prepilin-type N-terminal cleavage/methylation domain-containing protein [Gemmatimonadales bacterium]